MSGSGMSLPPVRHLPHWSRVGSLGRTISCSPAVGVRVPGPQQQQQLPPLSGLLQADTGLPVRAQVAPEESCRGEQDPRVASLQRNVHFLQEQHRDTLAKLHREIELLRRENKGPTSRRGVRPPTQGSETRSAMYLEDELQDTRTHLQQNHRSLSQSTDPAPAPELKGGLITSLQPLRIHSSPAHPPRPPTLHECEVIIRQLYNANSIQSQELLRIKALLRDIVFSKKITPENYILTKAYLADGTRKFSETEKLPKLGLQTFPEKTGETVQSPLILPALKQSLSSSIADRQRRTRAVQRSRFRRVVQ